MERLQPHPAAHDPALPGGDGRHHGEQAGRAAEDGGSVLAAPGLSQSLGVSQRALPGSHDLYWDVWRLRRWGGAAGGRGSGQDGRGVPGRQLEGQSEPLQSFGLDGDGSVAVGRFLGLLQRLHHQGLSVDCRFDGRRANRVPMRLRRSVGRQDQGVGPRGSCGSCSQRPGSVKQELGERDGGGGGGGTRGGRGVGFEIGGLRIGGDFDVGRLMLAGLRWRLGV